MQNVSETVRALVARYAKITLAAYLDGNRLDVGIGACELAFSCGDAESFSFGNACAAGVNLTLAASMLGLKGRKLKLTWAVEDMEHPLFDGQIDDALVRAGHTFVEAWDAMYYGGSDAFVPSWELKQDVDAAAAFAQVASKIGVEASPEAVDLLSGITIAGGFGHLPEEISNSAVAGHIAGLVGGNAMIDRNGRLTVRLIREVDYHAEPYEGKASAQGADYSVTGITLQREEIVKTSNEDGSGGEEQKMLEFGAGDGTLMISNPLADQTAADRAFDNLDGLTFRPGSYEIPGGILLEPGDVIAVHSMDGIYKVAVIVLTLSCDGGVKAALSCGGAAPKGGAQGAINQALATLYADFARLRTLVAENARITNARISNLTTDDITAGRIHSTDFSVEALEEVYPGSDVYPQSDLYPNNGDQIIRGFEIDFAAGVIRGVFWSETAEQMQEKIEQLEQEVQRLGDRLDALEKS